MTRKSCYKRFVVGKSLASVLISTTFATALGGHFAVAEENASKNYGLEEIVVTARKREENIQDTPVAITAFTAANLQMRSINSSDQLGQYVPNLTFDSGTGDTGGSGNAQVFIRGIGQQDYLLTSSPGVGIYIDGVYFPYGLGVSLDLLDVERIEVLRGPQGTLFGKNTIGGAINITTKQPMDEFSGKGSVRLGNLSRVDIKGSVNIPLDHRVLLRVAGFSSDRNGITKRPYDGNNLGSINRQGVDAKLKLLPSDSFDLLLSATFMRHNESAINNSLAAAGIGSLTSIWNTAVGEPVYGQSWDARWFTGDPFLTQGTAPAFSKIKRWTFSAVANWRMSDQISVKSITSYVHQDARFATDIDHSPLNYLGVDNKDHGKTFEEEIQLHGTFLENRIDWLLGAFYLNGKAANDTVLTVLGGLYKGLEALPGPIPGTPFGGAGNPLNVLLDLDRLRSITQNNEDIAVFSHVTFRLTDRLSFSGGLRYSDESKDFSASSLRLASNVFELPLTSANNSWGSWSPKVGIEYRWTDSVMTYISAAKGFMSGGFNGRPGTPGAAQFSYGPENVWSYEAGVKSEFLDHRVRFNAAAFYSNLTQIQLTSVVTSDLGSVIAVIENAGKAEIKGFEAEVVAQPTAEMLVDLGVGYIDAKYTELNEGVSGGLTLDSKLPKTPKWSITAGAQYRVPVSNWGSMTARVDFSYRSKIYHDTQNTEFLAQKGYGLINARLVFEPTDAKWQVALIGKNLTDKLYTTNGLDLTGCCGQADLTYGQPREYSIEFGYNF